MTKPTRVFAAMCVGLGLTAIVALAICVVVLIGKAYERGAELTGAPGLLLLSIAVVAFAVLSAVTYWATGRKDESHDD